MAKSEKFIVWNQYADGWELNADNSIMRFNRQEADDYAKQYNDKDGEAWRSEGWAAKRGECFLVHPLSDKGKPRRTHIAKSSMLGSAQKEVLEATFAYVLAERCHPDRGGAPAWENELFRALDKRVRTLEAIIAAPDEETLRKIAEEE